MAEEKLDAVDPAALPSPDSISGTFGDSLSEGTRKGEGNFFQLRLQKDAESGDQTFILIHQTCFVPSKGVPFSGMWLQETHEYSGTWDLAEADAKMQEESEKEENKEEAKVQVAAAEIESSFLEADADGSGSIGFEEIQAIEEKFGLPLAISANSSDWADGKISLAEFTEMLKANGNLLPPPQPPSGVITLNCANKKMTVVDDGNFVTEDKPHTAYRWVFKIPSPSYDKLELLESNYPVSLSRSRYMNGTTITLGYTDMCLQKQ